MSERFKGTGVALVTPFTKNKEVDFEGLARLIKHVTDGGVDYLVVNGTTGESATLKDREKLSILDFVIENNYKKLPVVYGIGGNDTAGIIDKIKQQNFNAVDAILSVSPYYNKPSQNGIFAHYSAIADASPIPVILYNVPGRTSSNMCAATSIKLSGHKNIIGIKEASGDLLQAMEIAKNKPDDFLLISGDDMLGTSIIALGGEGVISVLANGFPGIFSKMVNAALDGDFKKAKNCLFKFLKINPLMYEECNPVGIKKVLELIGVCDAEVRLPLVASSHALSERINMIMQEEGLFETAKVL